MCLTRPGLNGNDYWVIEQNEESKKNCDWIDDINSEYNRMNESNITRKFLDIIIEKYHEHHVDDWGESSS